jgi:hypothetical protein
MIYIPNQGNWSSDSAGNSSATFSPPLTGQFTDCYIILYNNSAQPSLPSNIFAIDIQS